jgi:hypothetical protein
MILETSIGSRGVQHILELFGTWLPITVPSYTSILNWLYRCGLHILTREIERREDWIFIIDHTIALGQTKCLVILGIPAGELANCQFSPSHKDVQVLDIEMTKSSNGVWCAQVIENIAQRVGRPVQIVADHGSDLNKGISLYQEKNPDVITTYDISHMVANVLKAELGTDPRWSAFLGECSRSLPTYQQTDLAFLLPPRQRSKARFMSVNNHIEWAQHVIEYHDRGDFGAIKGQWILGESQYLDLSRQFGTETARPLRELIGKHYPTQGSLQHALEITAGQSLDTLNPYFWEACDAGRARFLEGFDWILGYRGVIAEYSQLMARTETIQTILKTEGLHQDSHTQIKNKLPQLPQPSGQTEKITENILGQIKNEAAKIPKNNNYLASSDIIESVFGKYKSFVEKGPLKEIGKLVLTIPAFISDLSTQLVKEAMETVRMSDVESWVDENLGPSMLAKRRQAFKSPGGDTESA